VCALAGYLAQGLGGLAGVQEGDFEL